MLDDHLVERGVIALGNQGLGFLLVKRAHLLQQFQEGGAAVLQMSEPMLDFGGTEWMDIKADVLASAAVLVPFQGADLVEGTSKIIAPKRFVLVVLEAVLIVQVKGPEFAERHREIDFIGGIQ